VTREEIFAFMNENPLCYMATVEDGKPRVRGMQLYRADPDGIIFQTSESKDLNRQLLKNPECELCFADTRKIVQVRIHGEMVPDNDIDLRNRIIAERKFIQKWAREKGNEFIKIYRMRHGRALAWNMKLNFSPKTWVEL
jgi:pyridoxamine 5'-phosphate oxidase